MRQAEIRFLQKEGLAQGGAEKMRVQGGVAYQIGVDSGNDDPYDPREFIGKTVVITEKKPDKTGDENPKKPGNTT